MYAKDYKPSELMAAAAAKEIGDGEMVFVGIGLPLMAGLLAKAAHAPNITLVYESGCFGTIQQRVSYNVGDSACADGAFYVTSLWRTFSDMQRGYIDVGILGGAQIDRYGNLNTTVLLGEGNYQRPKLRLPGSGGGNDIGSSAKRTIIIMRLERRRFPAKVDYLTTPGHLEGWDSRKKAGLYGGGPSAVITDKCIFRFEEDTKEMYLDSLHPGVSLEDVKKQVQWNLKVSQNLKVTEPPTIEEVKLIREIDPSGIIMGAESAITKIENFDQWADLTERTIKMMRERLQRFNIPGRRT
ncbi:MAG: CoA-transferase [Candidatus Bathyarchaeia archaeon]